MANTRQIVRQLHILREQTSRTCGATIQDLVDRFGVTRRTIERDLDDLTEAGFPLYTERQGRQKQWRLYHNTRMPPLNFPVGERIALTYIGGIVEGTPFKDEFAKTLNRLRTTLPEKMRAFLEQAAYHPQIRG